MILSITFLIISFIGLCYFTKNNDKFWTIFSIIITFTWLYITIYEYNKSKTKLFKPEYQIELLNQNDVRIYNGKTYKTIKFDSIQDYIINDNE